MQFRILKKEPLIRVVVLKKHTNRILRQDQTVVICQSKENCNLFSYEKMPPYCNKFYAHKNPGIGIILNLLADIEQKFYLSSCEIIEYK